MKIFSFRKKLIIYATGSFLMSLIISLIFYSFVFGQSYTCVRLQINKITLKIIKKYTWAGSSLCSLSNQEVEEGILKDTEDMISITDPVQISQALASVTTTISASPTGAYTTYRGQKVNITFDPTLILTEKQKAKKELKAYVLSMFPELTDAKDLTVLMVKNSTLASSIKGILYKAIMDGGLE